MPPRGDVEARLAGLLKLAESGDVAQDPGGDLSYLLIQLYSFIIIYIYIWTRSFSIQSHYTALLGWVGCLSGTIGHEWGNHGERVHFFTNPQLASW